MILALILAAELIPVSFGVDQDREMAYLWNGSGKLVTAQNGLWSETKGEGEFYLPSGRRIVRVWRFAATDTGSCFEGDLNISRGGVAVYLSAPHKEAAQGHYEAWTVTDVDVRVTAEPFSVRYVCRVTCGARARCHYGLQLELRR